MSIPETMRRKLLILCAGGGFLVAVVLFAGGTIRAKANASGEANPRVFLQKVPLQAVTPSTARERTASALFRARHEAMGTVVLPTSTCATDLAEGVRIRVREKGAATWLVDERHRSDIARCGPLRAFEFPVVAESRGREYEVEVAGGRPSEVLVRYHVLDVIQPGHPWRKVQFLTARALQFVLLLSPLEIAGILLFAAAAALALLLVPACDPPDDSSSRRLGATGVFIATLVIAGLFSTLGVDPHHDGILLKPAIDVASGQMLFRDTFTQYGALTTLLQAGALVLAGPKLLAIRLLTALAYAGTAVFLYLVFARVLHQTVTFALLVIWIFTAPYFIMAFRPWSSVYALFFQMLATWLLLNRRFLVGGIAAGLTFWCRQPVGIFLAVAVLSAWVWLRVLGQVTTRELLRQSSRFVLGFAVACLPFFAWLAAYGALPDWWNQSIRFAAYFARNFGGTSIPRQIVNILTNLLPLVILQPAHTFIGTLSWWSLLPVATLIILIKYSMHRPSPTVIVLCFIGLASWLQYHPVPSLRHVYWAAAPMYGMLGLLLFQLASRFTPRAPVAVSVVALLAVAAPEITSRLGMGVEWWRENDTRVEQPAALSGLRLTAKEAAFHARFSRTMARLATANPDANIVTVGADALYLTYSSRARNVGKMYVNWGAASEVVSPGFSASLLAYIATNKPIVITDWYPASVPAGYCKQGEWTKDDLAFLWAPCG